MDTKPVADARPDAIMQPFHAQPAYVGSHTVRVMGLLYCPVCTRILRANDARGIDGGLALTCSGCHRDVISIHSEGPAR